jgi:hypothetical protein
VGLNENTRLQFVSRSFNYSFRIEVLFFLRETLTFVHRRCEISRRFISFGNDGTVRECTKIFKSNVEISKKFIQR